MDRYPPDIPVVDPQIVGVGDGMMMMEAASPSLAGAGMGFHDGGGEGAGPLPPAQAEVDEFLRRKRKAREHKACYPCRSRKVKCDLSRPCQTCRDREHPELCSYHPPNKRQNVDDGGGGGSSNHNDTVLKTETTDSNGPGGMVMLGRDEFEMLCQKLNGLEDSMAEMRRELSNVRGLCANGDVPATAAAAVGGAPQTDYGGLPASRSHTDVHGIHTRNDAGEIVHFGSGSIPAMLYKFGQGQGHDAEEKLQMQELLGRSVLPLFGLDNESATYPFVDLWGLPHGSLQRAQELARALPGDAQMRELFGYYRDVGHVIYPGIASPERLEEDLDAFLARRAAVLVETGDGVTEQKIYGRTYQWLAILFAVLASGAQCSSFPRKERELTSQVYVCCSFECLRFTNFLSQPHLESVQALLVIGNVLSNNMNAGTAWSLLGLTIRLAQGLGLHRNCPPHVATETVTPRSKVWWAIIWQDSLIAITYDRASATTAGGTHTMPMPQTFTPIGAYHAVMYPLFRVGLDIVRARATAPTSPHDFHARILHQRDEITHILRDAPDYLHDSRLCTSTRDTLEHWGLYLHSSYMLSELYRPALSPSQHPDITAAFKQPCIDHLTNTVEAYIGLANITAFARQSWAALHRALSSALLLAILGEHHRNERARRLIARFVDVAEAVHHWPGSAGGGSSSPQDVSAPVQRGIAALRKLNIVTSNGGSCSVGAEDGVDIDGRMAADGSSKASYEALLFTPPSTNGSGTGTGTTALEGGEDHSPYEVLNAILWGKGDVREETLVV